MHKSLAIALTTSACLLATLALANGRCNDADLAEQRADWCQSESLRYLENETRKDGKLLRLYASEDATPTKYLLKTAEGRMIDLEGFPQRTGSNPVGMVRCVMDRLKFDPSVSGRDGHIGFQNFGAMNYVLDGDTLYAQLKAVYPYQGTLRSKDGGHCEGDFDYHADALTHREAVTMCREQFAKDVGENITPLIRELRVYYLSSGAHYACSIRDANAPESDARKVYYYRINTEHHATPQIVLERIATDGERAKWKWQTDGCKGTPGAHC